MPTLGFSVSGFIESLRGFLVPLLYCLSDGELSLRKSYRGVLGEFWGSFGGVLGGLVEFLRSF